MDIEKFETLADGCENIGCPFQDERREQALAVAREAISHANGVELSVNPDALRQRINKLGIGRCLTAANVEIESSTAVWLRSNEHRIG